MKPLQTTAAILAAIFLVVSPLAASAAGTVTFSSPAAGAHYTGSQTYTISGTVSPAGAGVSVGITVKNPTGTTVDAASPTSDAATGAFSYATATGGSTNWVSGTYTVTATATNGATGSATFTYTASATTTTGTGTPYLIVSAQANSPVWPGQTETLAVLVQWNNGSLACDNPCFATVHFYTPAGKLVTVYNPADSSTNPTIVHRGFFIWHWTVPTDAPDGLYAIHAWASLTSGTEKFQGQGLASYTVNGAIANQASVDGLKAAVDAAASGITTATAKVQSSVDSISTTLGSMVGTLGGIHDIQTTLSSLSSSVSNLGTKVDGLTSTISTVQSNLASLMSDITALQSTIGGLSGLSGQITSLQNAVSSNQTYVLVVAALAAITLVLELAILVRKLS